MGFFKELGNLAGTIAGAVIGGGVTIVGEVTGSELIKDIGEGVLKTSIAAGNLVGQAADGATGIVGGIISQDDNSINKGFEDLGDATEKAVVGVVSGVGTIAKNTIEVVDGIVQGDEEKAINAGKTLVKVAAVSTLAIGVVDCLDIIGADGVEGIDFVEDDADLGLQDNVQVGEEHFVEPHRVDSYVRNDGTIVEGYWRDGDGNTEVNLSSDNGGGYMRTNPKV